MSTFRTLILNAAALVVAWGSVALIIGTWVARRRRDRLAQLAEAKRLAAIGNDQTIELAEVRVRA